MIKLRDSDQKISQADIKKFENTWKIILPDNYKKFLLKFNGGVLYDYHPFLSSFNSIKYHENNILLDEAYHTYCVINKDLDRDFLPIASSHTDNPITLCLKNNENKGKIILFYFDRDEEPELVSDSLEELLGVKDIDEL